MEISPEWLVIRYSAGRAKWIPISSYHPSKLLPNWQILDVMKMGYGDLPANTGRCSLGQMETSLFS